MKKSVLRKGIVLVLTMCLVLGLSLTTFAATANITLDKRYIHVGETVSVTVSLDEAIENVASIGYELYFNEKQFELVSSEKGTSHDLWTLTSKAKTKKDTGEKYYGITVVDPTSQGQTLAAGKVYTLTFKALENTRSSDVADSFKIAFGKATYPDTTYFTESAGAPVHLVVSLPKSEDKVYITDFPKLGSDNLTLHEIVLDTTAEIKSQTWDGDTLNVVLAEGTADATKVEAEFHVSMLKEDGEKGDYNHNGFYSNLTADDCNVHRESGKLENGRLTLSGAFELCSFCESEEDKANYDLVFTPKTYTLNFTVEGSEKHTITIADSENGTVTADKTTAAKDETVTLTVTPDDGYELDTLTVKSGDTDITVNENKFTMPDGDVTITATFVAEEPEVPATSIIVKAKADVDGTVTVVEKGKVNFDSYTDVPYQLIQVPKGTTSVDVTFAAGTKFCGENTTYCYWVNINKMTFDYDMTQYAFKSNDDGTITVTVPIENFKYEDGYGIALEDPAFNPVNLMTFQEVESTEAPHTCVFDQKNTDSKFLKSEANCESPAVYYYSCTCGEKGTETFTSGEKGDHVYEGGVCTGCGQADPSVSQYTVALGEDKNVSAGETVEIPVTIGHTNSSVTTYNAFDLTFTYDPAVLKLDMEGETGLTITDNNGTLRILRYGDDLTVGEPAFTLKFTALTAGEAKLTATSALVGISEGAITGDANKATITNEETNVTVGGYTVNLPEDFTGASTVESGASYTFTAKDKNYTYKVSATMGGEKVDVTDNGDGTFTIANVTGNLVITTVSKTQMIFNVTLEGEGLTGPATAKYQETYTATLTKESGYNYEIKVTVGGKEASWYASGNDICISGSNITGDVKIVVTRTKITPNTYSVTFDGNASGDAKGAASVNANGTYTFTVYKDEGATYTVTATMGGKEATVTETGTGYSIANVTGDLVITVNKQSDITVEVSAYLELDGKTMFLVKANGTLAEGYAYAYDGTPMFKSNAYDGSWVYLVMVDEGTLTADDAKAKITSAQATFTTLEQTYDVNETGKVDVNDAQLVYDLYNTKYQDFTAVSMQKFLKADTNADGKVDVADATAIVSEINNLR